MTTLPGPYYTNARRRSIRLRWAVVAAIAAGCFMLAWVVELWLVVLAIPSAAVLTIASWVRTRWRLLPRMIAVETVIAVEDTCDDQERAAIALALAAHCDAARLRAAAARLPHLATSPEQQRYAERRLAHATSTIEHPRLAGLVPPPRKPSHPIVVTVTAAALGAILWSARSSRWWLIPLGVGLTVLASALHDWIEHHRAVTVIAHAAIDTKSAAHPASPARIAHHALDQPAVLKRAHHLIAETPLPPDTRLAASERLHEAIAHTRLHRQQQR